MANIKCVRLLLPLFWYLVLENKGNRIIGFYDSVTFVLQKPLLNQSTKKNKPTKINKKMVNHWAENEESYYPDGSVPLFFKRERLLSLTGPESLITRAPFPTWHSKETY